MKRHLGLLMTVLLLLAFVLPTAAQEEGPPRVGLRPDAPEYALHGPYWVGTMDFVIDPDSARPLQVHVWYPALNPERAEESVTYTIGDNPQIQAMVPPGTALVVHGHAVQDAAPAVADAPYPLVVFSHGVGGWGQASAYLFEHLASFGFVVIAPDHYGETFVEYWAGAVERPLQVYQSIAFADELTGGSSALAGMIDTQHIATAGHSYGGFTALIGGGAQMNLDWCTAHPELVERNAFDFCNPFRDHQEELAAMAGLDSVPTEMWPAMNDPRVEAVIAVAPIGDVWGADYEGASALTVPAMVMTGSGDTTIVPEIAAYPIYEHLGSANKTLVVFENADHLVFFTSCPASPWLVDSGLFSACADAVWDMYRAQDLTNHFTTAFLLDVLKGDEAAHAALAPDAVSFPGITYQAEGF